MYTTRILPPEEWHRLPLELPESPLAAIDLSTTYGYLIVLERDGILVGHWPLFLVWHAEPLFIKEADRVSPAIRTLVNGLQRTIAEQQIPMAFAMIEDPATAAMAQRLGFKPTEAPVYYALAPAEALDSLDVASLVATATAPPKEM